MAPGLKVGQGIKRPARLDPGRLDAGGAHLRNALALKNPLSELAYKPEDLRVDAGGHLHHGFDVALVLHQVPIDVADLVGVQLRILRGDDLGITEQVHGSLDPAQELVQLHLKGLLTLHDALAVEAQHRLRPSEEGERVVISVVLLLVQGRALDHAAMLAVPSLGPAGEVPTLDHLDDVRHPGHGPVTGRDLIGEVPDGAHDLLFLVRVSGLEHAGAHIGHLVQGARDLSGEVIGLRDDDLPGEHPLENNLSVPRVDGHGPQVHDPGVVEHLYGLAVDVALVPLALDGLLHLLGLALELPGVRVADAGQKGRGDLLSRDAGGQGLHARPGRVQVELLFALQRVAPPRVLINLGSRNPS